MAEGRARRRLPAEEEADAQLDVALRRRELQRARESGRADDDHWHVRRDGEKVFCSGITVPLEGDGIVGFAKICRNFSEEELRERQREIALQTERGRVYLADVLCVRSGY